MHVRKMSSHRVNPPHIQPRRVSRPSSGLVKPRKNPLVGMIDVVQMWKYLGPDVIDLYEQHARDYRIFQVKILDHLAS
jgi:hypothetical protein